MGPKISFLKFLFLLLLSSVLITFFFSFSSFLFYFLFFFFLLLHTWPSPFLIIADLWPPHVQHWWTAHPVALGHQRPWSRTVTYMPCRHCYFCIAHKILSNPIPILQHESCQKVSTFFSVNRTLSLDQCQIGPDFEVTILNSYLWWKILSFDI